MSVVLSDHVREPNRRRPPVAFVRHGPDIRRELDDPASGSRSAARSRRRARRGEPVRRRARPCARAGRAPSPRCRAGEPTANDRWSIAFCTPGRSCNTWCSGPAARSTDDVGPTLDFGQPPDLAVEVGRHATSGTRNAIRRRARIGPGGVTISIAPPPWPDSTAAGILEPRYSRPAGMPAAA